MKRRLGFTIIIASLSLGAVRADAPQLNSRTIHSLYQLCTDSGFATRGYCLGFIDGVGEMMHASNAALEQKGIHLNMDYCAPASTTREQTLQAFKNLHDQHPEDWQLPGVVGVLAALQATWPCPGSQSTPPPAQQK